MSASSPPRPSAARNRVLLVDDHAVFREGFAELLNSLPDLHVCGEAATAAAGLDAATKLNPNVAVVDLSLQGGSGMELIKNLKSVHPQLPTLVLSMHDEALYAERALQAGALGYVMKQEPSKTVVEAIRTVLKQQVFLSHSMRGQLLQNLASKARPASREDLSSLTDREIEVLQLLGEGRTTRQIAERLNLSISTVETHRAHIKEKLHLRNANELVRRAVEWANMR